MAAFHKIEEALEDLKKGKIILVTDDAERENEGDFICAAQFATTENINFMATYGKGLICMVCASRHCSMVLVLSRARLSEYCAPLSIAPK